MRVLVTGSSGFTGRYITALLNKEGIPTIGLSHGQHAKENDIACDLSDLTAIKNVVSQTKPTHIIHLAGLSFVAEQDQQAFYRINLFGTQNLLEALTVLATPPEKIVIASSANVYGLSEQSPLKESTCPAPVNHYGISKLAMEHMVHTWFDRFPIIITRPFNYTGPGQDIRFLVPKIVHHFRHKQPTIELGNLNVSRDFLDVRDVAAIYYRLLQGDAHSEIINLCSGNGTLLKNIVDSMNHIAGYQIKIKVNPAFVRQNEIAHLVGDNSKLKQQFSFVPQFSLNQTLSDMYQHHENTL